MIIVQLRHFNFFFLKIIKKYGFFFNDKQRKPVIIKNTNHRDT